MAINRVDYNGTTLIDLSATTATADTILRGFGAFGKDGNWLNGTAGGGLPGVSGIDVGVLNITADIKTSKVSFSHKVGAVPDLIIVYADGDPGTYSMDLAMWSPAFGLWRSGYTGFIVTRGGTSGTSASQHNSTSYGISDVTSASFSLASDTSSRSFKAGTTYRYIAIKY